ncbi:MAG: hypothetical protein OCD02_09585 [Spirochaetaceae bacterium]
MNKKIVIAILVIILIIGTYLILDTVVNNKVSDQVDLAIDGIDISGMKVSYGEIDLNLAGLDMIISDVRLTSEDDESILIEKVTIEKIDLTNDIPQYLVLKAKNIRFDKILNLKNIGLEENVSFDVELDYKADKSGDFNLNKLNIYSEPLGELDLSLKLGNVELTETFLNDIDNEIEDISLYKCSISYDDFGFINKITTLFGSLYGATSEEFSEMISGLLEYQSTTVKSPDVKEYLNFAANYIVDPTKVTITVAPNDAISIKDLDKSENPFDILELLNLKIKN